jgi:hypothetical protein
MHRTGFGEVLLGLLSIVMIPAFGYLLFFPGSAHARGTGDATSPVQNSHIYLVSQVGGDISEVVVEDNVVYLSEGPRIIKLDLPSGNLAGQSVLLPGLVKDLDLEGAHLHAATDGGYVSLAAGSLMAAANPGGTALPLDGIAVDGSLVLATGRPGLYRISTDTVLVTEMDRSKGGLDIANGFAFIASFGLGMRTVDLRSGYALIPHAQVGVEARDVLVEGNRAFVSDGFAGLRIIDISNPRAPLQIDRINPGRYAVSGIDLQDDIAYVPQGPDGLNIVDVTPGQRAVLTATYATSTSAISVGVNKDMVGVLSTHATGARILDLSTPTAVKEIGAYNPPLKRPSAVAEESGLICVGDAYDGLRRVIGFAKSVDPAQPANNVIAKKVIMSGNLCHAIDQDDDLVIMEPGTDPPVRGEYDGAFLDVAAANGMTYLVGRPDELTILDTHLFHFPIKRGSFKGLATPSTVALRDKIALVGDNRGLTLIDVTDPAKPAQIGFYATSGAIRDLAVAGDIAYLAIAYQLHMINIADPHNPNQLGVYALPDTTSQIDHVAVVNDTAFVADWRNVTVRAVDVKDPLAPRDAGFFAIPSTGVRDLAPGPDVVYVAAGSAGLFVLSENIVNVPGSGEGNGVLFLPMVPN